MNSDLIQPQKSKFLHETIFLFCSTDIKHPQTLPLQTYSGASLLYHSRCRAPGPFLQHQGLLPFSQAESRASPGLTQECVRSRNAKDLSSEAILHLLAYFGSLKTGLSGPLIGLFCGWFIPPTGSWISLSCIKVGRQCVTTGCSDHQLELMVVVVYSLSCI